MTNEQNKTSYPSSASPTTAKILKTPKPPEPWASISLKEAYQARFPSPQDEAEILERVGQGLLAKVEGFGAWTPLSLKDAYQARKPRPEEERESLLRIRQKSLEGFAAALPSKEASSHAKDRSKSEVDLSQTPGLQDTQSQTPKPPVLRGREPWPRLWKGLGWSSAGLGIFGLLLLLVGQLSPEEFLPPLQSDGFQPVISADKRRLDFGLAALQEARLEAPSRWKVKIFGGSKLSVHRHAAQKTSIQLQRGRLRVEVQPNKGEAFSVSHQGWQVTVVGTGFSVEQEASWLRVEVWSGRVLLQGPKESLVLRAGHAARIDLLTGTIVQRPAPLDPEEALQTRLRWLFQQPSSLIVQDALDLLERPSLRREEKIVLLQETIQTLFQRGEVVGFLPLFRSYQATENDRLAQETFLYPLLLRCYKRLSPSDCLPLSGHYLRAFGEQGMRPFVARIRFLHATALLKDKARIAAGLRMLQSHREDFPKAVDRRRVCDQIQSILRQAPPDLAPIQIEIGPATPWFQKHCRFP